LKSPPEAGGYASRPGAVSAGPEDVSHAERVKYGTTSRMPGAVRASSDDLSNAERLKFGSQAGGAATKPGAVSASNGDVSSAERLKFGTAAASMPGAVRASNNDVSSAERLKFGSATAGSASMPGAVRASNNDVSNAERLKFGAAAAAATASMPGAVRASNHDVSNAERLKFGAPAAASTPGAVSASNSNMSNAERLKFGHQSNSAASVPWAASASNHDVSNAERLKFGMASTGVASMPGATRASNSDVSNAERLKFGHSSSGVASMPGATNACAHDVSNAERLKFGNQPAGVASMPGSMSTSNIDVSNAERLKFGHDDGRFTQREYGARYEDEVNVSDSERLKFGDGGDIGAMGATDDGISAAERLKFDESLRGNMPRGTGRLKSSGMSDDDSDEYDGIEMQYVANENQHDGNDGVDTRQSKVRDDSGKHDPEPMYVENEEISAVVTPIPNNVISHNTNKREASGWRDLCILSSCCSIIVILSLSIALGVTSNKNPSAAVAPAPSTAAVVMTTEPTLSPSNPPTLSPTLPPVDFTWCYESAEDQALQDDRYLSLRYKFVRSGVSTDAEFYDELSYQRKSLCWLAFGDRLAVEASDPFAMQRYILATIYYGLGEPQRMLNEGWLSGQFECEWTPLVGCDSRTDSTVTRLALSGTGLTGELPKEMEFLTDIDYIDFSVNELSGNLTNLFDGWRYLDTLKIASNSFQYIPENLYTLTELTELDISLNDFVGPIPSNLGSMTNLVHLDLSQNAFNGIIPDFRNLSFLSKEFFCCLFCRSFHLNLQSSCT